MEPLSSRKKLISISGDLLDERSQSVIPFCLGRIVYAQVLLARNLKY